MLGSLSKHRPAAQHLQYYEAASPKPHPSLQEPSYPYIFLKLLQDHYCVYEDPLKSRFGGLRRIATSKPEKLPFLCGSRLLFSMTLYTTQWEPRLRLRMLQRQRYDLRRIAPALRLTFASAFQVRIRVRSVGHRHLPDCHKLKHSRLSTFCSNIFANSPSVLTARIMLA